MLHGMWRRGVLLYLGSIGIWLLLWGTIKDWGIGGLLNAWAFWLLAPALPLGAARLGARRSIVGKLSALAWLAVGGFMLVNRYQWLRARVPARASEPAGPSRTERGDMPGEVQARPLRIMSLNVLKENQNPDDILRLIRREAPDVVLLQELESQMSLRLHEGLDEYDYCHWESHPRPGGSFGFFSRLPFEITGSWDSPATRPYAVRATLNLSDGPVDLYNIHLISIGPAAIRKTGLTGNFRLREAQVAVLADEMQSRARPALALGDFNMTEGNEAYRQAEGRLVDAWLVAGQGPGWTWPRSRFPPRVPVLRLDYCFCTPAVQPVSMRVFREGVGSDHCPIMVDVAIDGHAGPRRLDPLDGVDLTARRNAYGRSG